MENIDKDKEKKHTRKLTKNPEHRTRSYISSRMWPRAGHDACHWHEAVLLIEKPSRSITGRQKVQSYTFVWVPNSQKLFSAGKMYKIIGKFKLKILLFPTEFEINRLCHP